MAAVNFGSWVRRRAELRHGVRIVAAGLSSFALARVLDLPQGYWAVFTAVLVVQASVGGSLKAAIDRFIGTLAGAVYGALVATLIPHQNTWALGAALTIALTPLAFAAALSASFRVAPVTAVILLLGNVGASEAPALAGFFRTLEVSLGGIVGLIVSLVVLPARGHAVMCKKAEGVALLMAALAETLFALLLADGNRRPLSARHDGIQTAFDQLEAAALEANRERKSLLAGELDPDPIPRTLRRIYHDLVLISRVADEPLSEEVRQSLSEPLSAVAAATAAFLKAAGHALAAQQSGPPLIDFTAALSRALPAIAAVNDNAPLVALAFALEQMQRNFRDLARRADEFAQGAKSAESAG